MSRADCSVSLMVDRKSRSPRTSAVPETSPLASIFRRAGEVFVGMIFGCAEGCADGDVADVVRWVARFHGPGCVLGRGSDGWDQAGVGDAASRVSALVIRSVQVESAASLR